MQRILLLIAVVVGGCSYTFDSGAPSLPYLGTPPDTASLPRLNAKAVDDELFALGGDGRVWLIMSNTDKTWTMIPMSGEAAVDTLASDEQLQLATWRALYIFKRPIGSGAGGVAGGTGGPPDMGAVPTVELIVRSVGESPGHSFTVPDGSPLIYSMGTDDAFAYVVTDNRLPGYLIQRRDGSFSRIVPWPKGIDPGNPFKNGGLFFTDSGAGNVFYDRDADGRVVGHHTHDNLDVDLGIRPRLLGWVDSKTLATCGDDGVRLVPVDGVTPETVLDNDICKQANFFFSKGSAYYYVGTTIRRVKLDGSAPPETIYDFGTNRVVYISTATDGMILYSTDPANRYAHAAGDGWLGSWRFMERGNLVAVSSDHTIIHYLEHSAQGSGIGDLTSVTLPAPGVPGGAPVTLTRNTRNATFLADGRMIADENRASSGTWNRIVVIDELRGHKQYVAEGASYFSSIPFTSDFIVELITGGDGHDLVRVQIPPINPPPPPNK